MVKGYYTFVEDLSAILIEMTGLDKERFYFQRQEENDTSSSGDRLYIEVAVYEDAKEVCGIYTEELYDRYSEAAGDCEYEDEKLIMLDIAKDICGEIQIIRKEEYYKNTKKLNHYESAKENLFVRLINYNKFKEELENVIFRRIGDIALVLYMKIGEDDNKVTSVKINKCYASKWNIKEEELFRNALINTYFMSPPRIFQWEKLIFDPEYDGENFMNLLSDYQMKKDMIGNCLSTTRRTNGAVAIFLPGVAERLCALMGTNIYLVFTSIHEVMIHNDSVVTPAELEKVLKETIEQATPETDYLTSHIYHYNSSTGEFTCV